LRYSKWLKMSVLIYLNYEK